MRDKFAFAANAVMIILILILNYFYQSNGFDFTLKCICSGGFALLGIINLFYAIITKQRTIRFHAGMTAGLILAFLGDVLIGYDFIIGAATFALGHICFVIAYCCMNRLTRTDVTISGAIFLGALLFLLFCPLLTFEMPPFRFVCIAYALIISLMLGKATGNFMMEKNSVTSMIIVASTLFFFSDLMLVFDWFIGIWDWTSNACMGTYYPALCMLAFSMFLSVNKERIE